MSQSDDPCQLYKNLTGGLQQKYAATLAVGEGKSTEVGFYETISITVQNSTERPWKRGRFNRLPSFGQREELSFVPPCLVLTKGPGISFFIICDFLFDVQYNAWLVLYFISLLILVICGSTLECSRLEVKFFHFYESIAKKRFIKEKMLRSWHSRLDVWIAVRTETKNLEGSKGPDCQAANKSLDKRSFS